MLHPMLLLRQFIEELDSINEDAQAMQGDIGLNKFVAATMVCNKDILSRVGSTIATQRAWNKWKARLLI